MTFSVSVLYPNHDDTTFDMKYYLDTHIPLVEQGWRPLGLLKWEVVEFGTNSNGEKPQYCVGATLTWKDKASFSVAEKDPVATKIFGDIPNFCNKSPTKTVGKIVGSG